LDLRSNQIYNYGFLKNLTQLNTLDLSDNQISNYSFLKNLTQLNTLDLSDNQISDIRFLNDLNQLNTLNLSFNQISDIRSLKNLKQLNALILIDNQISNIRFLKDLKQLKILNLSKNQVSDIRFLKSLTQLNTLYLGDNKISDISSLNDLTQLNTLELCNNQISDIHFLEDLKQLHSLVLSNNKISDIPKAIFQLGMEIELRVEYGIGLTLYGNTLETPPIDILKQGNKAVLNYFNELEKQGTAQLYEAKMLIVGEGGSGKTSLAVRLQDRKAKLPAEKDTTKGIDIQQLVFPINSNKEFTINIWDFGGQEIYHATHQFFLTKRSLYILVDDTRKDDKSLHDATFRYWLQTVELFGDNSPLLIVQNEKGNRSKDIDLKSMQGQFGFIKEKYQTNLLTNKGLDELEKDIKHYIQKLPHIGQEMPAQWVAIRKELVEISKKEAYITLSTYYDICSEHTIREKERAKALSQYLHDLGTFLHFQDDPLLTNFIFLQNEWVTDAVYQLLDHEPIKENKGHFTLADTKKIWLDSYEDMHHQLLALLLNFELCYKIPDNKEEYMIPQLLPESQPDINWDNTNNLQLRYQYGFMPKGLLSRFIVRTHTYLKDTSNAWKKGVVLERKNTSALIKEVYAQNEITIHVKGTHQKELMTIIAEEIDKLNKSFGGIKVQKLIPCNCNKCVKTDQPYFYKFKSILKRIEDGKKTIECDNSYKDISVMELMDNLFDKATTPKKNRIYGRDIISINVVNIDSNVHITDNKKQMGTPTKPSEAKKELPTSKNWWESWLFISVISGVITFLLSWWIVDSAKIGAVIGLVMAIGMLFRNPERWLRRLAQGSFAAFLGTLIFNVKLAFEVENFSFKLTDPPTILSLGLLVFGIVCIIAEHYRNKQS